MSERRSPSPLILILALLFLSAGHAAAECPGGGPGPRRRPLPVPGLPPGAPPDVGGSDPSGSGRRPAGVRTAASVDARTWEYWWALNQSDFMPVLGYDERDITAEGYAAGRNVARERALDLLLEALKHKDDQVRTAAARSLTVAVPKYRAKDQQSALMAALDDPYREVREIAGLALARRGAMEAAEPLRKVLKHPGEHRVTRAFAAMALTKLKDAKGIELAKKISNDAKDPDLAGAILIGFGASGDRAYTKHLLTAMRRKGGSATRRRRVQCDAMMALGKLADPAAIGALSKRLRDRERLIQRAAALALGGFDGQEEAAEALVRHGLSAKDHLTRAFAVISLCRLHHKPAYDRLQEMTGKDRDVVQGFALLGLGLTDSPAAGRALLNPLRTKQRYGQFGAAALAAGLLHIKVAEKMLADVVGVLKDPRAEAYASVGLGLMGADRQGERLRRNLWINSSTIQYGVPIGLGALDAAATAKWLESKLLASKRDSERGPLIDALSMTAGSSELQTLTTLHEKLPGPDRDLERRLVYAYARILTDHKPTWTRQLCTHTYFPFNNDVLAHLLVFP